MRKIHKFIIVACAFFGIEISVYAQPNDLLCNATALPTTGACVASTNVGATTGGGGPIDPVCWLDWSDNDVWFSFVADNDSMEISTDYSGYTLGDIEMAVYSSSDNTCSGTLTEIGCNEDAGATFSSSNPPINNYFSAVVVFNGTLIPGNTYFVVVDGGSGGTTGTFCISAGPIVHVLPTQTPNELIGSTCALATIVHPNNLPCAFDNGNVNLGGTAQWTNTVGVNYCGCDNETSQKGGWITFTANSTSTTITNIESVADVDITVFSGTCSALTCISCTSRNNGQSVTIATTIGTQYFVLVTPQGGSTSNTGTDICITSSASCTPPPNDNCSGAISISAGIVYSASVYCATADDILCSGSTENNIWYSWTVPAGWIGDANFSAYDHNCVNGVFSAGTQVSIYDAGQICATTSTCAAYANIGNDNDYAFSWTPTPGATYLINFDGNGGEVCNFSFTIAAPLTALPIELLSFTGECTDNHVQLNWQTATETNNNYFVIERAFSSGSSSSLNWSEIGIVNGAGNSSSTINYNFDFIEDIGSGILYYRLKQVDYNGSYKYYGPIPVNCEPGNEWNLILQNTPDDNELLATLFSPSDAEIQAEIFDIQGRKIVSKTLSVTKGSNLVQFDLTHASSGFYIIRINDAGRQISKKFVKK